LSFNGVRRSVRSRRKPGIIPAIAPKTKEALLACEALPEEVREQTRAIIKPLCDGAIAQDTLNRRQRATYDSFPGPHGTTHLPDSAIDPLAVGTPGPLGLDNASVDGSSNDFARGNHGHETPLTTKGDLLSVAGSSLARLGVGANGAQLEADSTQSTGLKWGTQGQDARILSMIGIAIGSQVEGFI